MALKALRALRALMPPLKGVNAEIFSKFFFTPINKMINFAIQHFLQNTFAN